MDGQLHVVYPDQALCLRLASAKMSEYAVNGEYAYFISASDIVSYVLARPPRTRAASTGSTFQPATHR
jgi:hypothetical protein